LFAVLAFRLPLGNALIAFALWLVLGVLLASGRARRVTTESPRGGGRDYACARRSLSVLIAAIESRTVHPAVGDQVTAGLAEPPKAGAELAGVAEPGPVGGLLEGKVSITCGTGPRSRRKPIRFGGSRVTVSTVTAVNPDPTGVRCAARTICPARSRISTFSRMARVCRLAYGAAQRALSEMIRTEPLRTVAIHIGTASPLTP
jgi:hypothetical protein